MPKLSPLASVAATREVLEKHGLATKKALGQHFLINDHIVSHICELAELNKQDVVLEVGPGIGTLTLGLLAQAAAVVAVERDRDLPAVLADTCAAYKESFTLISADALTLTEAEVVRALATLPCVSLAERPTFPQKFVANLPYAVAASLILSFFERFPAVQSATVMVQSEVADRIFARPGTKAYGAYTVKLGLHAKAMARFTVAPGNFFPPPRVESAVVRLDRRELKEAGGKPISADILKATALMADAAFANRRKTILNSCKSYFAALGAEGALIKERLPELFERAAIPPTLRGEALAIEDYCKLSQTYERMKAE